MILTISMIKQLQITSFSNEVYLVTCYSRGALRLDPWSMPPSAEETGRNSGSEKRVKHQGIEKEKRDRFKKDGSIHKILW